MRILLALTLFIFGYYPTRADSLTDIAQFAQSICGDIPEGTLTKSAIQGKVAVNAGFLARLLSGDAEVSASRTNDIYKGIPFDKLPDQIPTVAMCKSELAKLLIAQKALEPPPLIAQYTTCSGEYERACQPHDSYFYCYTDIQKWANDRCESAKVVRLNTYGGNKCGYAMDRVFCTNPK